MDCFVALLLAMTRELSSGLPPRSFQQRSAPARSSASAPGCCRNRDWPPLWRSRDVPQSSLAGSCLVAPKSLADTEQDALPVGDAEFEARRDPSRPLDEMRCRL